MTHQFPPEPERAPARGRPRRRLLDCQCHQDTPDGSRGAACSRTATAEDLRCDVCRIGCHPLPLATHSACHHRACFAAIAHHNADRRRDSTG